MMEAKTLPACPVETTLTLISDKWKVLINANQGLKSVLLPYKPPHPSPPDGGATFPPQGGRLKAGPVRLTPKPSPFQGEGVTAKP